MKDDVTLGTGDFYDHSTSENLRVKFQRANFREVMNLGEAGTIGTWPITGVASATDFRMNFPLLPQADFKDLRSERFEYNNTYLKLSSGLPLISKLNGNGNLKLDIEYDVFDDDLSNSGITPSQKIKLSLKKSDFSDGSLVDADFYEDDNGNRIKNKVYDLTTNKISLVIPINDGQDMWLRIGPDNINPSGLYTKISNIKMVLESD